MKKIFALILPIGISIIIFTIFLYSEKAYGAVTNTAVGAEDQVEVQHGTDQAGYFWYDELWNYRRPVTISYGGTDLPHYQVLIKLDDSNFDFEKAVDDGSDIRFTLSDGRTPVYYWIESWDSSEPEPQAYLWVLVPTLLPGNTTIYLYYNNPNESTTSNGLYTFDFFDDDWCQFSGAGCTVGEETQSIQSPNDTDNLQDFTNIVNSGWMLSDFWSIISGSPTVSGGILSLVEGTGIKTTTSAFRYNAVGFRANFGLGGEHERGGFLNPVNGEGTMIGDDCSSFTGDLFLINSGECNQFNPQADWHNKDHVYEVRWSDGQSIGDIDHGDSSASSTAQVPSTFLPVTLYSYPDSNATLMVDWIYVRQYRNPEPTSTVGVEQGLVDLGISMADFPDPVNTSTDLTYLLTISNTSSIEAIGVVVTDTLPGNVQFVSGKTSPECSQEGSEVICGLNPIAANSTASIVIVVNPNVDGVITNTVTVASSGFDLDMGNNGGEVTTLVDSVPPNVNWEKPVHNGQSFTSYGGLVSLEASATDNDQVDWVEFWLWDHLPLADPIGKISLGFDNTYPYQMQFNSDILVPNQMYQMFVQAADRADNISSIYTVPHPVIYIERILLYFLNLPIVVK